MATTRVVSYNPYQRSDEQKADAAVREVAELLDLGGLQEYGGAVRRESLHALADIGIGFYKPKDVPTAPPLLFRLDRFQLLRGRAPLVADGRRVLPVPGKRAQLDDLHATVGVFRDLEDGDEVVLGNIHTPAHVEFWPGPRRAMYREAIAGVVADMYLRRDRPAYLVGDWNWDLRSPDALPRQLLKKRGLVSCWSGNPPNSGTHGKRTIDGAFARDRADAAEVLTHIRVGDHLPVAATYTTKEHR